MPMDKVWQFKSRQSTEPQMRPRQIFTDEMGWPTILLAPCPQGTLCAVP
jgi:hypothetical protein